MKKKTRIYLAGILTAGCMMTGNVSFAVASTVPQVNGEYFSYNYIVSGKDGYFLLCGNLIGYWDGKKEHQALPLCNRPDCSHNTSDCVAYVQILEPKLFYVDDSLYIFGQRQYNDVTKSEAFPFWKIAADGSSKLVDLLNCKLGGVNFSQVG